MQCVLKTRLIDKFGPHTEVVNDIKRKRHNIKVEKRCFDKHKYYLLRYHCFQRLYFDSKYNMYNIINIITLQIFNKKQVKPIFYLQNEFISKMSVKCMPCS